MKGSFDHKKIITILFITAIVLIFATIISDKIIDEKYGEEKEHIENPEIDRKFISAVRSLGVDSSWIIKRELNKESQFYSAYAINIPRDLPAALIIKEITNAFDYTDVNLNVLEKSIAGRTQLKISSGNKPIITANFDYVDSIKRKAGSIGFILEGFEELDIQEDSILLNSPEACAITLIPSKENIQLSQRINEAGKEYIVVLNDDITELTYKLKPGYSEPRLVSPLRSILGDFNKAVFIMIDDESDIYNSSVYALLKIELEKRGIKFIKKSTFRMLDEDNIRAYLRQLKDGDKKSVIMDSEDYLKINNVLVSFRKIGYKFINPSVVAAEE